MAIQTINIGNIANDGTGDDLRVAFAKVNSNFDDLDTRLLSSDTIEAENLGSSGEGLFAQRSDNVLQFRSLVAGEGITLTGTGNTVVVNSSIGLTTLNFVSDSGSIVASAGANSVNINGGQNIDTRVTGSQIFFDVDGTNLVQQDTAPVLGGSLNANNNDIINGGSFTASQFNGPLEGLVYGIDIRNLNQATSGFDFGGIQQSADSFLDFLILDSDVDFGTFAVPNPIEVDRGALA